MLECDLVYYHRDHEAQTIGKQGPTTTMWQFPPVKMVQEQRPLLACGGL